MTPRARLMTCRRGDSVRELMSRNTGRYSFLPVLDEKDGILGLYRRNGPRELDSVVSEIFLGFQAAKLR